MQDLNITLVQPAVHWHNPEANRTMLSKQLADQNLSTDLIILPEMFTTGFTMDTKLQAEEENGPTYVWMKKLAKKHNCVVTGSIIVKSHSECFNRLLWIEPDGKVSKYDKRHLFRMANEHDYFSEGKNPQTFQLHGWRLRVSICYDLRFPVWSRNSTVGEDLEYDILLFVANWPAARISAWDTLLKARAIENLSYSVGVNRTGLDGEGIEYNGHSACYDFKGDEMAFLGDSEMIKTISISKNNLIEYRTKFPAFKDADQFNLKY